MGLPVMMRVARAFPDGPPGLLAVPVSWYVPLPGAVTTTGKATTPCAGMSSSVNGWVRVSPGAVMVNWYSVAMLPVLLMTSRKVAVSVPMIVCVSGRQATSTAS